VEIANFSMPNAMAPVGEVMLRADVLGSLAAEHVHRTVSAILGATRFGAWRRTYDQIHCKQ
jgi:hypothetical protein